MATATLLFDPPPELRKSNKGNEAKAYYLVRVLSADSPDSFFGEALKATGLPVPGSTPDPFGLGCICDAIETPKPIAGKSKKEAIVPCTFKPVGQVVVGGGGLQVPKEVSFVTRERSTSKDANGRPILVKYRKTEADPYALQVARVRGYDALGRLELEKSFTSDPEQQLRRALGALNADYWRGESPCKWRFATLNIKKLGETAYLARAGFDFDENTHLQVASYVSEATGYSPDNIDNVPLSKLEQFAIQFANGDPSDPGSAQSSTLNGVTVARTPKVAIFASLGFD